MDKNQFLATVAVALVVAVISSAITASMICANLKSEASPSAELPQNVTSNDIPKDIDDGDASLQALLNAFYEKRFEAKYNSTDYSAYLPMRCNGNDVIISGFCLALPYYGGDNVHVGSSVRSKDSTGKILEISCDGANYDLKGRYDVIGSVICLNSSIAGTQKDAPAENPSNPISSESAANTKSVNTSYEDGLPENFSISIYGDGSNSGEGRTYESYLSFRGEELIFGNKTYSSGGRGGTSFCIQAYDPDTKDWGASYWEIKVNKLPYYDTVDYEKNYTSESKPCPTHAEFPVVYLTREEMVNAIKSGELIERNASTHCHFESCYELLEE